MRWGRYAARGLAGRMAFLVLAWMVCAFPASAAGQGDAASRPEAPAASPLDFVVVLPGAPEAQEDALAAVNALAEFVANRTGRSVRGGFGNDPEAAAELIEREKPSWGVVSLGFYLQYARRLKMTPIAATRPGGRSRDVWRVLTAPDYAGSELSGDFLGSMLYTREAAACLLLRGRHGDIVGLRGERSPLMVLRDLGSGPAGVVLDDLQYAAVAHLPYKDELRYKVLYEVGDLPTAPVVWFGAGARSGDAELLLKALRAASGDVGARPGLELLRGAGFGPADGALAGLLKKCGG